MNLLLAAGIDALRVPYSGSMRGFKGDVHLTVGDKRSTLEAKSRKSGFKFIYKSLADNDYLCIKRNNSNPLIIMDFNMFIEILKVYNAQVIHNK